MTALPCASPLRKKLKIAILGGGVGGSSLARWLREVYGDNLDLTVICDGPVGGRCQSISFEGQEFEAGASIVSELNDHFIALMKKHKLKERCIKDLTYIPTGVFNGKSFAVSTPSPASMCFPGLAKPLSAWRLSCKYGFRSLMQLKKLAKGGEAPDFKKLYKAQDDGQAFTHPTQLLEVLRPGLSELCLRSAEAWLVDDKNISQDLVQQLATGGMRANYGGQSCSDLHALVGLVSLAGGLASRCFSVVDGNRQVPLRELEAAAPRLLTGTAKLVQKRTDNTGFEVHYFPGATGESMKNQMETPESTGNAKVESFDLVVIAHALERSGLRIEGYPTATWQSPGQFQRCVAHFVKGALRPEYFDTRLHDMPFEVLTTADSTAPFYSIGLQFPVSLSTAAEAKKIVESASRGEPQVFKVFAPRVLSKEDLGQIFSPGIGAETLKFTHVDWYAYPTYEVPQKLHPFVLDPDGLFYLNSIEQAASAMEMSLISARNAVNLITEWVDNRRGQGVF